MLDYFGIPAAVLPELKDSVDDFGVSDPAHFGVALPIRGVAGDQQAALVGQGCLEPGMTKSTYGTGCFLMTNTGDDRIASKARLLTTVGYRIDGKSAFALEGSIFSAGAAIKWLRDRLGLIGTAAESEVLARRIEGETPRRLCGPRLHGTRRTALAAGCPRTDHGAHPRRRPRRNRRSEP